MRNTGNRNTGDWNTGDRNTGDRNTGNWNTGDWNTGDWNTGNCNTGNCNTGNWNTGNWNSINLSTGFFNTIETDDVMIFNKNYSRKKWEQLDKPQFLYFGLTEWVSQSDMTKAEKEENPSCKEAGGYLRKYEYKEAFKKSWDESNKEDRAKVFNLPNFDADVFKEISGIDVNEKDNSDKINELKKSQEQLLKQVEEIKKQIEGLR